MFTVLTMMASTAASSAFAQWHAPDENSPACVASPAALANKSDIYQQIQGFTDEAGQAGLDALRGTWKFSNIFARATISFDFTEGGFFVQSEDDVREQVSICFDDPASGWIRVAVHEPGCPENTNLYIRSAGPGAFSLKAYSTRSVGSVKFTKRESEPQPPGQPKPPVKCQLPPAY